MDLRRINDDVSVAPQIAIEDVAELAAMGFRSVICNRPDNEDPGQPDWAMIEAAAKEAGLETRFMPVMSGGVCLEDGDSFRAALSELPKPLLAYCRSGTRCAQLWTLSQAGDTPADEIVSACAGAGYDVRGLVSRG